MFRAPLPSPRDSSAICFSASSIPSDLMISRAHTYPEIGSLGSVIFNAPSFDGSGSAGLTPFLSRYSSAIPGVFSIVQAASRRPSMQPTMVGLKCDLFSLIRLPFCRFAGPCLRSPRSRGGRAPARCASGIGPVNPLPGSSALAKAGVAFVALKENIRVDGERDIGSSGLHQILGTRDFDRTSAFDAE